MNSYPLKLLAERLIKTVLLFLRKLKTVGYLKKQELMEKLLMTVSTGFHVLFQGAAIVLHVEITTANFVLIAIRCVPNT
jgi:hypothetical protein